MNIVSIIKPDYGLSFTRIFSLGDIVISTPQQFFLIAAIGECPVNATRDSSKTSDKTINESLLSFELGFGWTRQKLFQMIVSVLCLKLMCNTWRAALFTDCSNALTTQKFYPAQIQHTVHQNAVLRCGCGVFAYILWLTAVVTVAQMLLTATQKYDPRLYRAVEC